MWVSEPCFVLQEPAGRFRFSILRAGAEAAAIYLPPVGATGGEGLRGRLLRPLWMGAHGREIGAGPGSGWLPASSLWLYVALIPGPGLPLLWGVVVEGGYGSPCVLLLSCAAVAAVRRSYRCWPCCSFSAYTVVCVAPCWGLDVSPGLAWRRPGHGQGGWGGAGAEAEELPGAVGVLGVVHVILLCPPCGLCCLSGIGGLGSCVPGRGGRGRASGGRRGVAGWRLVARDPGFINMC